MFWNNFLILCNKKGVAPNTVCADLGLSTAIATKWKNGAIPRPSTMRVIAMYFGVSVEYLMGETEDRSPIEYSPKLSEGEEALLELFRQIPEDKQNLVLQMIEIALKTKQ